MNNMLIEKLKSSTILKNKIISLLPVDGSRKLDTGEKSVNFTMKEESDLHLTLGAAQLWITGEFNNRIKLWDVQVRVRDKYDFDKKAYSLSLSGFANDVGCALQQTEMIKTFITDVTFKMTV